ncbi:hypothetical protein BG015_011439 [Linnemannia schmuckeri]|uniref:F-box domain-containing protein n=1 Tax=Linnemannia schmuckeri TaxID=64567 RepID=A0A9P5RVC5_9FUNG|nr:hypothetical protein BG015_011439 [Linnemannia schmuckeri]
MHSRLTIFEIPHVLDLICNRLATNDLISCTQVSFLWHGIFQSHLIRHIRFVDLNKETTWDIFDHANRIKSLKIDIADGDWFLTDGNPTATATITAKETTSPCINLEELYCVDFGYFEEPTRPTDERYGDWVYPDATPAVEMNRIKPYGSSGVTTNALRLIQQNPRLHTLTIEHRR